MLTDSYLDRIYSRTGARWQFLAALVLTVVYALMVLA